MTYGRLAQLVEHLLDVQEVTGSSPVPSTIQFVLEPDSLRKRVRVRFLFIGGSAEGLLGAVNRNEQRQGIIVVMVSCLLCYMTRLGAIAAYVRTRYARIPKGAGRQWRPQNACILKRLTEPTGEKQPLGTQTLEQSLVCYTLPEVYSPSVRTYAAIAPKRVI